MGCLSRNGVGGLCCPLPSEQRDGVSHQWVRICLLNVAEGAQHHAVPSQRSAGCWAASCPFLSHWQELCFAQGLPRNCPWFPQVQIQPGQPALVEQWGLQGRCTHPISAFPLGHSSWRCIFSQSKCGRQGAGVCTALSPCNCHSTTAQPWHYLCRGMSCPRKSSGSRDGFPWAQDMGAAMREVALERLPLSSGGISRTFGSSNVHQTLLVPVTYPWLHPAAPAGWLRARGKAGVEDTHIRRTNLDGPSERCQLAHSPRKMATKSTRM